MASKTRDRAEIKRGGGVGGREGGAANITTKEPKFG